MPALRLVETKGSSLVGLGARVMLLASDANEAARLSRLIAGFGGVVEHEVEMYAALSEVIDDPKGWDLFVIACDGFGGIEAGRRAHRMLGAVAERLPTILISEDCDVPVMPEATTEPVMMRAGRSAEAMRPGMEHAMRGRMALHAWRSKDGGPWPAYPM